jgi:hypothetical protein
MANPENLVPNEDRTPSQRRANASKAGKASARKRRERRDMRETFREMLDMPLHKGSVTSAGTMDGMDGKNMTVGQAIALAQLRKAMAGDTKAAEFIRDTSGQRPSDRVELTAPAKESAEEFSRLLDGAMGDGG